MEPDNSEFLRDLFQCLVIRFHVKLLAWDGKKGLVGLMLNLFGLKTFPLISCLLRPGLSCDGSSTNCSVKGFDSEGSGSGSSPSTMSTSWRAGSQNAWAIDSDVSGRNKL